MENTPQPTKFKNIGPSNPTHLHPRNVKKGDIIEVYWRQFNQWDTLVVTKDAEEIDKRNDKPIGLIWVCKVAKGWSDYAMYINHLGWVYAA